MRGKLFFVLALVLLMLFAVLPVMAASPKKIPVTAITSNQVTGLPEKEWTTDGGIIHQQGRLRTGVITLTIDGQAPLVGVLSELMDFTTNTKIGELKACAHKCVFTFAGGSFEGVKTLRMTSDPVTKAILEQEQHAVLQGSGAFEGCTLMLSQDWELTSPPVPKVYTGFLLIP
jgi:hypothetical protein